MSMLLDEINAIFDKSNSLYLRFTRSVEDFENEEIKKCLKEMYKSPDSNKVKLASILNAIYTQQIQTFLVSKRILNDLIRDDINSKLTSVNSRDYKSLMFVLIDNKFLSKLRSADFKKGKAGVYKLSSQAFLENLYEAHNQSYFKQQENFVLDFFDSVEDVEQEVSFDNKKNMTKEAVRKMMIEKTGDPDWDFPVKRKK